MTLGRRFAIALTMLVALGSSAVVGATSVLHPGQPGVHILGPRVTAGSSASGPENTIWESPAP
jgi:hypothetical protein